MDTVEKLEQISQKINGIGGRLIVASMSNPIIREAHKMTIDLGIEVDDLINELMNEETET